MRVEIWSDVVCPWCYLGKVRFDRALRSFVHRDDVEVFFRSFELDPDASRVGTTATVDMLAGKYGMTAQQATDAQLQMQDRAQQDGLTFRMDGLRSGNTRDAHRLLQFAGTRDRQAQLVERLHRAYFTEQLSVFDVESLTGLATDVGLDRREVDAVLAGSDFDAAVVADENEARELGISGVPFFVIDRKYGISGAQPTEALSAALEQAWSESH